jgi:hypothetical protein
MPLYPYIVLEVGSAFRIPTFRNYTLVNPQMGSPRDLGVRHKLKFYILNARDFVKMLTIYSRNKWENVKNKLTLLGDFHGPNEDGDGEFFSSFGLYG